MTNKAVIPAGIYGITASPYSKNRSNTDVVKAMLDGGIRMIQYREKHKWFSIAEMYNQLEAIRKITWEYHALLIVNDFIDLALAVEADGVHIGQDDLPPQVVRKLIGEDKIMGISTHSPEQALRAVDAGADYIGVGPLFPTSTKENVCDAVGLEYLDFAMKNISIPFVAIGGIKEHNIHTVLERGATRIALVTEIVQADNIKGKTKRLISIVDQYLGD